METKHTKGKWVIYPGLNSFEFPGIEAIHESGNFSIVCVGNDFEGVQGRNKDEIQANAKLIAAAPDLLEALQELYDFTNNYFGGSPAGKFARNTAFKAIKKATE